MSLLGVAQMVLGAGCHWLDLVTLYRIRRKQPSSNWSGIAIWLLLIHTMPVWQRGITK